MASVDLGAARLNKESGEVRELKEQVDSLNKALARKEAELAQLQSQYKLHTPRRLSVEGTVINNVEVQNGNCNRGMFSQDYGEISKLNNEEMPVDKPNGNRRSLVNERRNLSVVKIGTQSETNTASETPSVTKKTSQIKKSLQSFGKQLINGGVKRIPSEVESSPVCRIERRLSVGRQSQPLSNRQPLTTSVNGLSRRNSIERNGLAKRNSIEGKEK